MQSPYRDRIKPPEPKPAMSLAVPSCIALGLVVQFVGLITHALDGFGHLALAFAFALATAGLLAGEPTGPES